MSKDKTRFVCQECGALSTKWNGQCGDCKAWNSITEEKAPGKFVRHNQYAGVDQQEILNLQDLEVSETERLDTGLTEFNRVLGGGLVAGSAVLVGGDPGVGKSTIVLQILSNVSKQRRVLYVTGEESPEQVKMRAERLGLALEDLYILATTQIEVILDKVQHAKPDVVVLDSIQTLYTDKVQSAPGSVSQVREATSQIVQYAKQTQTAMLIIGHVTKEGAIAGPRVLEHMVDAVLYFEGRQDSRYRLIRAVKNRFGAVNELGIFAMTDKGLKTISNPSAIFIRRDHEQGPGSVIMVTWEGSRPLLVEVQSLVDTSHLGNPRRIAVGLDQQRLAMLLAVLNRHCGVATHDQDVFINVVGGVKISETASDLAVVLSVLSSLRNTIIPNDLICFGEVGLGGEIRPVQSGQERLKEAAKHGFKTAIIPKSNHPKDPIEGLKIYAIEHLREAIDFIRNV